MGSRDRSERSAKGIAKVDLGLGRGKHSYDKRATLKDRDWKRDKARIMKAGRE